MKRLIYFVAPLVLAVGMLSPDAYASDRKPGKFYGDARSAHRPDHYPKKKREHHRYERKHHHRRDYRHQHSHGHHYKRHRSYHLSYYHGPVYRSHAHHCGNVAVSRYHHHSSALSMIAGGVIGGAIGHEIGHGDQVATAAGAVVGAAIGHDLGGGRRHVRVDTRYECW